MIIQTTIICLHQALIYRVNRTKGPNHSTEESERRCKEAAIDIIGIVRYMGPNSIAQVSTRCMIGKTLSLFYLLHFISTHTAGIVVAGLHI